MLRVGAFLRMQPYRPADRRTFAFFLGPCFGNRKGGARCSGSRFRGKIPDASEGSGFEAAGSDTAGYYRRYMYCSIASERCIRIAPVSSA